MSKYSHKDTSFLREWSEATENLAEYFASFYFGKDFTKYWVADEIGGCLVVNEDYFFNVGDMFEFLYFGYNVKQMFDYYHYALDCHEKKESPLNIKSWRKLRKNVKP